MIRSFYSAFMSGNQDVLSALGSAKIVYLSKFVLGEKYTGSSEEKKNGKTRDSWSSSNQK
jgi:hypothetical protein